MRGVGTGGLAMKRSIKQGQRLWTRRGVLGLLVALMSLRRIVRGGGKATTPKLSLHEADYYRQR